MTTTAVGVTPRPSNLINAPKQYAQNEEAQFRQQVEQALNTLAAFGTQTNNIIGGHALTRVNDTNVTLTLDAAAANCLVQSSVVTLGWTGQLGLSRGGTHADLSATGGAHFVLRQSSVGADVTVSQLAFSDLSSTLAYAQLPTGGGTWANGGALSITGGVTTVAGLTSSALITASAGLTVASGQTLTVTGATITGLTAASVGAGTFPSGTFVVPGTLNLTSATLNLTTATVSGSPTWSSSQAITISTATQASITTMANLTTVGALASGSIAAGFGNIDNAGNTLNTGAATVVGLTSSAVIINNSGGINITGAAASFRSLRFQTAGVGRWTFFTDNGAESGSNAGSDFQLSARDDTGAAIDSPIMVTRAATGMVTFGRPTRIQQADTPTLRWSATNPASDEKNWDAYYDGPSKVLYFRSVNDALNSAVNWLAVARGTGTALLTATFGPKVVTAASATGGAGFNLPHGAAPTSPGDGDLWTTTAGLYVRINGVTVGPLS